MTPEYLERNYLSIRFWVRNAVIPATLGLLGILIVVRIVTGDPFELNHASAIAAFFAGYFVLIRAGHLFMIRSMHFDLKKSYAGIYPLKLAELPENMNRRNLGFSLAKIKSELIHRHQNLS